ncbi:hypothetical protein AcV5_005094 [Taiwanofungus camphoratus]|nr:hypothetical protein AcV5_005094 [Antrodia cinnamomea]
MLRDRWYHTAQSLQGLQRTTACTVYLNSNNNSNVLIGHPNIGNVGIVKGQVVTGILTAYLYIVLEGR